MDQAIKTLPREPWRGSMICGWQTSYGMPRDTFCAQRKADDLPMCEQHFMDVMDEYGMLRMAPGVALGASRLRVRLLWEPEDGAVPVEASAGEIARYAGILDPARGE
jgi:hypothetical protein